MTYKDAGVDTEKARRAHKKIESLIKETFDLRKGKFGSILGEFGHYAALIDIGGGKALALHTDNVGTKVFVAQLMDKYDTVGIDCVAMNANDLICVGAEPIALIDYLAVQESNPQIIAEIMKGLVVGAKEAGMMIIGGETATVPELIKGVREKRGFDLSALSVGVVEKDKVILGERIDVGDVVIGLRSTGIHSNGLTLARKALLEKAQLSVHDNLPGTNIKTGNALLMPTKIYVKEILAVINDSEVTGLAHITGGSFSKLERLTKGRVGFDLDQMPQPQPIFEAIQNAGNVSTKEMYKTFNMGIGFCIIAPQNHAEEVISTCKKHGSEAQVLGITSKRSGVRIVTPSGEKVSL